MDSTGTAAVDAALRLWKAVLDGRPVRLSAEGSVHVAGHRTPTVTADQWALVGGLFTDARGWRGPAAMRECLDDALASAGDAPEDPVLLVGLGLELTRESLRAWHAAGFAARTDGPTRKKLTKVFEPKRQRIAGHVAARIGPRPPRDGLVPAGAVDLPFPYPDDDPTSALRRRQVGALVDALAVDGPVRRGLVDHLLARRGVHGRSGASVPLVPRESDLLRRAVRAAVAARVAFYGRVLYAGTEDDARPTRYTPDAAAKRENAQPLRLVHERVLRWSEGSVDGLEVSGVRAAAEALAVDRFAAKPPAEELGTAPERVKVVVDLAVADVVGAGHPTGPALIDFVAEGLLRVRAAAAARPDRDIRVVDVPEADGATASARAIHRFVRDDLVPPDVRAAMAEVEAGESAS